MKAYAQQQDETWYLGTSYGTFEMLDEITARRIAHIMNAVYEQGKRDKTLELREALYIYDEIYDD